MFGDAPNKADINFVLGALADMFDHRLRMLERASLQAHGHPNVAMVRSLGNTKRDERLRFGHPVQRKCGDGEAARLLNSGHRGRDHLARNLFFQGPRRLDIHLYAPGFKTGVFYTL
jgi:hypothetical protein